MSRTSKAICTLAIPTLRKLRQEDNKFENSLDYIASSRPSWTGEKEREGEGEEGRETERYRDSTIERQTQRQRYREREKTTHKFAF